MTSLVYEAPSSQRYPVVLTLAAACQSLTHLGGQCVSLTCRSSLCCICWNSFDIIVCFTSHVNFKSTLSSSACTDHLSKSQFRCTGHLQRGLKIFCYCENPALDSFFFGSSWRMPKYLNARATAFICHTIRDRPYSGFTACTYLLGFE
jgi:hypothetical protein